MVIMFLGSNARNIYLFQLNDPTNNCLIENERQWLPQVTFYIVKFDKASRVMNK